jgi:RNA polymerase sigma-70 factor (ECF subfamily)
MAAAVEERLNELWLASRASWPGVEVSAAAFQSYIADRLPAPIEIAAIDQLSASDLYLACACVLGAPGALASFERGFLVHVARFVARLDGSHAVAEEVRQTLRERLFVGSADSPARLVGYQGRGPLLGWVRVAALRCALDLLRDRDGRAEVELDDGLTDRMAGDIEDDLIKAQYRYEFEDSVAEALRKLPQRDRNLLRLHFCGKVSTHKLATMFGVDQSTVVRWLAAARTAVRDDARARLLERLQLTAAEVDSLAGLLVSRLDLSLAGCLRSIAD